ADIRFDGEELSKEALYSALWDNRLPLPEQLQTSQDRMSTPEAQEYLQNRLSLDIGVTTPPQMVLSLIPMPYALLIDPDFEEQTLTWQDGVLTVNGEEVM
ncbi:MAG: hypothetical protein ACTH6C_13455, partial [Halomonas sp.]